MRRFAAGLSAAVLLAVAAYSINAAVTAAVTRGGKHYTPWMFWTAIGLFWIITAGSLWGAHRIYRRRFVRPSW